MKSLTEPTTKSAIKNSATYLLGGEMVKGVVDIKKGILAIDAEMHADLEKMLLENGSNQYDLWGINLWLDEDGEDFLEFDSMINLRPAQGNRSRSVDDPETRQKIKELVEKWVK